MSNLPAKSESKGIQRTHTRMINTAQGKKKILINPRYPKIMPKPYFRGYNVSAIKNGIPTEDIIGQNIPRQPLERALPNTPLFWIYEEFKNHRKVRITKIQTEIIEDILKGLATKKPFIITYASFPRGLIDFTYDFLNWLKLDLNFDIYYRYIPTARAKGEHGIYSYMHHNFQQVKRGDGLVRYKRNPYFEIMPSGERRDASWLTKRFQ